MKDFLHSTHNDYESWRNMRARCLIKSRPDYKYYGGRGIKVCKEWNDFKVFIKDMGPRPSTKHGIDRINNNGNYEPKNCKWSTPSENNKNKRLLIEGSSQYRYVTFCSHTKGKKKWVGRVKRGPKNHYIGIFLTELQAHKAALSFIKENSL